jgi:ubiquinone/menaquinone biosynthesis C-methylase UbiE
MAPADADASRLFVEGMKKETHQEDLYHLPYHWMLRSFQRVSTELRNQTVVKALSFGAGHRILDLGCGDGFFTGYLKRKFAESFVVGADYFLRAIRFARIMTNDNPYVAASAMALSFKSGCFDAVFLMDVIEHLDCENRKQALREVARALRPGGVIVVTVPSNRLPVIPMHYHHFDTGSLARLMQEHFTEVEVTGCCRYLPGAHHLTRFPVIWRLIQFAVRECDPHKAITLIACAKKISE